MPKGKIKPKRTVPKPSALAQLLRFKPFIWNGRKRRMASAFTIYDLRKIANRRTPKAPFDYADGSADREISLSRARKAFESIEFHPNVLRDVSGVDTSKEVLGKKVAFPIAIAPTGFTRMMHTEGEYAGATAAEFFGIPFALSTMGTRSIEEVAKIAPAGNNWFQLYVWKDRERSLDLLNRAKAAGFGALVVTVDVPVAGERLRDKYNGMTIPPTLTLRTILNALPRTEWWINFLTTEPLEFASLGTWNGTVAELLDKMFDPTVTLEDLKWIKQQWGGKLVVKGIQTLEDAKAVASIGADAIVLSNHGGRQLDQAPVPLHLLPSVRKALDKRVEIYVDTGVMHGSDVVAALAQGADMVLIGRAYLYGLMAGGREGVDRSLEILHSQMVRTLKLLGVRSISELKPKHVSLIARGVELG
jgi:L-lactate dehydrogenase (cytochrome)/glycolate oxidase